MLCCFVSRRFCSGYVLASDVATKIVIDLQVDYVTAVWWLYEVGIRLWGLTQCVHYMMASGITDLWWCNSHMF